MKKPNTKKAKFLSWLVENSYDLAFEMTDSDASILERYINMEKNDELKEALIELNDFLTNY